MFNRLCPIVALAVLIGPACGGQDPELTEIERLETPIPATLGVFARHPSFVSRMPGEAAFAAYRGEGDVWRELSGDGRYEFDIEHPRYTLWLQCLQENDAPGQILVLHLGAGDTDRPVIECPSQEPDLSLSRLDVNIEDTQNNGAWGVGVAMGRAETPVVFASGGFLTYSFYGPGEGINVDRLSVFAEINGSTRSLRVDRDIRISGHYAVDADYTGHALCTNAQIPGVGDWYNVSTRYVSGGHSAIQLREFVIGLGAADTATVSIAPEIMRDADDIHWVHSRNRSTDRHSYRVDPRDASFAPVPALAQPGLTVLEGRGLQFEVPDFEGQGVQLTVTSSSSPRVSILASSTWLDGAQSIPTPAPPSFDSNWRLGNPGTVFNLTAIAIDGNRSVQALFDDYLFHPNAGSPRRWDGLDVTLSANHRGGLLP